LWKISTFETGPASSGLSFLKMAFDFPRQKQLYSMFCKSFSAKYRRLWVHLHEKGGKRQAMSSHHHLDVYLHAYIDGCGLATDPRGPLFRTIGRGTDALTTTPLAPGQPLAMIRRRAAAAAHIHGRH
jgi:integrase/recombinase XerC